MEHDFKFPNINIFTIAYNQEIVENSEPGYLILDHTDNERSDWREYWPIRKYLLNHQLNEDEWYGFFSPRFNSKTGISYLDLTAYIKENCRDKDVCTFSPQVDIGAFFQNVYYGGEQMSPGFLDASQRILDRNQVDVDLGSLFMDSRTTVFSNYIVAKPIYWREWLRIGEMIFKISESPGDADPLKLKINEPTVYPGSVERKVFIIEALASLVLNINKNFRVHGYNPYVLAWSSLVGEYKKEAAICDALKTAMSENPRSIFKENFKSISNSILTKGNLIAADPYMLKIEEYDQVNQTFIDLLPSNLKLVVELGCMRGSLAKVYKFKNNDTYWVGIDKDGDHLEAAKFACNETHCVDVEGLTASDFEKFKEADAWVLGRLLERLVDPWALLKNIVSVMKPNAILVFSIQNSQHWSVQAQICLGQFRYQDNTNIDKSYLRFFSRQTILEMLGQTGLKYHNGVSIIKNPTADVNYIAAIRALAQAVGQNADQSLQDSQAFEYVMVASRA